MEPNQLFHYFGLYGLVLGTLAITFMLYRWRGDRSMTISLHAAADPTALVMFGATATLSVLLIYPFFFWWFIPTLQLPVLFSWLIGMAGVFQVLIGWVPDKLGRLSRIHNALAFSVGAMIVPLTAMIALSSQVSPILKYVSCGYLLLSLVFMFLYFFVRGTRKHILIYQLIFFWGFLAIVLCAAYVR